VVARFWLRALSAVLVAAVCVACARRSPPPSERSLASLPASAAGLVAAPAPAVLVGALHGDAARGKELVQRYECNRCHEGTGLGTAALTKNCFSCHEQITRSSRAMSTRTESAAACSSPLPTARLAWSRLCSRATTS
jgi:hypothetical protein